MSTKIAIQINSLEALERLMQDPNGEISVEIKQAVVQEFAKKHLKAVATEDIVQKAALATREWIDEQFFDIVKDGWKNKLVFKEETMKYMKETLDRIGRESVKYWTEDIVGIDKMEERVKAALENATETITTNLTGAHLESRLKYMVDRKLQQMSELASKLK